MKVIAVDFDGTITNGGYNLSGTPCPVPSPDWPQHKQMECLEMAVDTDMANFLLEEHDGPGGCFIVVHTARPHSHHKFLRLWLTENGVPFDAIVCGKIRADMYIDDKAFTPEDISNGKNCTTI